MPPAVPSSLLRRLTISAALLMVIAVLTAVVTVHAGRVPGQQTKKPPGRRGFGPPTAVGPRQSSQVALTGDNLTLVNVNPEANTITVFGVSSDTPIKLSSRELTS